MSALGLARHVTVKFLVDDLQFLAGEGAAVFVGFAQTCIVEKLLPPDIRTDEREIAPANTDVACQRLLQRAKRALSRRRGTLGIHHDRELLSRQQRVTLD